jgi:hypothetical protein
MRTHFLRLDVLVHYSDHYYRHLLIIVLKNNGIRKYHQLDNLSEILTQTHIK